MKNSLVLIIDGFRFTMYNLIRTVLEHSSVVTVTLKLGGREFHMAKTVVRKNESLDDALRRFKRTVSKSGTLQEYRKREFYEKPSVKRKLKSEAARKRNKKKKRRF